MNQFYASRSRYEAYQRCSRYGYLNYNYGANGELGKGLQRASKSVPLDTGIWTHRGLEAIGRYLMIQYKGLIPKVFPTDILTIIINVIKQDMNEEFYINDGQPKVDSFFLSQCGTDFNGEERQFTEHEQKQLQLYTFLEQQALVEALLRVFVLRVLPGWAGKYRVSMVEKDMDFPLAKSEHWEITQSATIDWVLQEIESKDIYLVSFKTAGQYTEQTAKQNSHDFQGISETWAFEKYLQGRGIKKQVEGVKMIHFIKGQNKETKRGSGVWEQRSPLVRGYRNAGIDGVGYAWSYFYPKATNQSGYGALGKGWEGFNVWSEAGNEVGGISGWINLIDSGQVQPEMGDMLGQQVIESLPIKRDAQEISDWYTQILHKEMRIAKSLNLLPMANREQYWNWLNQNFEQNRQACHYYPSSRNDCQFISICHGTETEREYPSPDLYQIRVPHHAIENRP